MTSHSGRGGNLLIAGSLALIGVLSLYYVLSRRDDRGPRHSQSRGNGDANDGAASLPNRGPLIATAADADEVLVQLFEKAAAQVATLPDSATTQSDKLLLYALYKQATVGNRNIDPPSRFNVVAHAKYTAWGEFEGMEKQLAMIKYIEAAQYLQQVGNSVGDLPLHDDNADIVYDDDDAYESSDDEGEGSGDVPSSFGGSSVVISGMGIRPSTLAGMPTDGHEHSEDVGLDGQSIEIDDDGDMPRQPGSLIKAAMSSDFCRIQEAIDSGASISEADETGQTALHFAADRGAADCVTLLLRCGADPNSVDREGISVLQAAVIGGDVETVRILLEAGGDPDHEDTDGDTPRTCANDDGSKEMKALFR